MKTHAAVFALFCFAACAPVAHAQNLSQVIVGKWRFDAPTITSVTSYQAIGTFTQAIYIKGIPSPAMLTGQWEVRNGNQLWRHNLNWSPRYTKNINGVVRPVVIAPWECFTIQVVDNDHMKIPVGIATRIE